MSCNRIDLMPDTQVWVCQISDETFETYGMAPTPQEMRQEFLEYEREQDWYQEQRLVEQFVEGLDVCPDWPFYADDPFIVQEPQVFGP